MNRWLRRSLIAITGVVVVGAAAAWVIVGPSMIIGLLRYDQREEGTLKVGDLAPDLGLIALDGATPVQLRDRMSARTTVLIFGSFT